MDVVVLIAIWHALTEGNHFKGCLATKYTHTHTPLHALINYREDIQCKHSVCIFGLSNSFTKLKGNC